MFSAFNPSKCTHLEQWAADCAAPGEQSWTSCQSRDFSSMTGDFCLIIDFIFRFVSRQTLYAFRTLGIWNELHGIISCL